MFPQLNSNLTILDSSSILARLIIFTVLSVLSGCAATEKVTSYFKGGSDNAEPPNPLVEFRPLINVIELWKKDNGVGTDEQYLKLAPVVVNQRLYVVDSVGSVGAVDAINGKRLWQKKIAASASVDGKSGWFRGGDIQITGGPGYGDNTIMVGSMEGEVISLSADNGTELWRTRVSSEVLSAPQRAADIVVVRTIDGKVFGIDGEKGRRLWVYDRTVPPLTLRGTSTPAIDSGIVVAGFDGGKMAALDVRTGRLLWETSIATARGRSELERMVDIDAAPMIVDGAAYIATFQGHVAAVQLETGRILWSNDLSSYAGFSADEQNIYVTDENSHLWALDRFNGTVLWEQEDLHARAATAPGVVGDQIVVGDLEGYLHWVSKKTGEFTARTRLCKKPVIAKPLVVGKIVYAYCSEGRLAAYTYR